MSKRIAIPMQSAVQPAPPKRRQNRWQRRREYEIYISGSVWKAKRRQALEHYGNKCWRCENTSGPFEVHHLTYIRFGGQELMRDLRVLCEPCHRYEHNG